MTNLLGRRAASSRGPRRRFAMHDQRPFSSRSDEGNAMSERSDDKANHHAASRAAGLGALGAVRSGRRERRPHRGGAGPAHRHRARARRVLPRGSRAARRSRRRALHQRRPPPPPRNPPEHAVAKSPAVAAPAIGSPAMSGGPAGAGAARSRRRDRDDHQRQSRQAQRVRRRHGRAAVRDPRRARGPHRRAGGRVARRGEVVLVGARRELDRERRRPS